MASLNIVCATDSNSLKSSIYCIVYFKNKLNIIIDLLVISNFIIHDGLLMLGVVTGLPKRCVANFKIKFCGSCSLDIFYEAVIECQFLCLQAG